MSIYPPFYELPKNENEKPWLHLHVGMHKTGSTALQNFLSRNPDWLKKNNLFYPRYKRTINHRHLGKLLLKSVKDFDKDKLHTMWNNHFAPQLEHANGSDIILSYEGLLRLGTIKNAPVVQPILQELIKEYRLHIIAYLRRQDLWLHAMYNQNIKAGRESRTLEQYIDAKLKHPFKMKKALDFWENKMGAEHMTVRVYDRSLLFEEDIISDVMKQLGLAMDDNLRPPVLRNRRLSEKALKWKRTLNSMKLPKHLNFTARMLLTGISPQNSKNQKALSSDLSLGIMKTYAPINRRVAIQYFGRNRLFKDS